MNRIVTLVALLTAFSAAAQTEGSRFWDAYWIDVSGAPPHGYGVYHFRKTFDLASKPQTFVVDISGDNRYQFYVNGSRVATGPARGDLAHWRYEAVDIADQLHAGNNVLAAVVWNDGDDAAVAQISNQTGFVLRAEAAENIQVNTDKTWRCLEDKAYTPRIWPEDQRTGYYALGPNETFQSAKYPWGWEGAGLDDSSWLAAHEITRAAPRDARDSPNRWMLVRSELPLEEQTSERLKSVRRSEGVSATDAFLSGRQSVTIAANATAKLLLDQSYLTTAYPELTLSGGSGARVELQYAETLFVNKSDKGNRNEIDGKSFFGPSDVYLADGGKNRRYRPLFWRTYRYLQLSITTAREPLTLEDIQGTFSGYPFQRKAQFALKNSPDDAVMQKILATGFRTARLCAHETYMDCPYYEQLQYAGDARIQMMVSLYTTGDARLMKNGISLLNDSRTPEGATYSRAPSHLQQYIPPFSLWWIGMIHDYWMYVDDPAFVKDMQPGVRSVLAFYAKYQKANRSLIRMPWWNFVDWVKEWPEGEAPAEPDGSSSAALDLQLALAYSWAADLENAMGSKSLAQEYAASTRELKATVLATDWDATRGLFADQPSHKSFSQHVNTLAIMAHLLPREDAKAVMLRTLSDSSLAQSSIYFRAYTNAALREVDLGDRYLDSLAPWREMLSQGLTTWAEWSGTDARSDCHAWGASPNFELLRTVAGIESAAPGFQRVRIAPNLGSNKRVSASMPHPKGQVDVDLLLKDERHLVADITLPDGINGELEWSGLHRPLIAGKNHQEITK